jgi:type II secretory pathway predicted ATPase ExeA
MIFASRKRALEACARRYLPVSNSGTGKTTALRRFSDELKNSQYTILYISDSKLTPRSFYRALLEQLGVESSYYRSEAKRQLHKEIEIMKGVNHLFPVAIVDESHLLEKDMLEEIRFLLNFKMDSQSPLALILSGQSELWEKLRLQSYAAIRQRIDVVCAIGQLDRYQVSEYIQSHLVYAGCDKDIFSDAAIDDIFKFSGGTPRLINKACTSSLMYGAQNRKSIIDDRMVKLVIEQELG